MLRNNNASRWSGSEVASWLGPRPSRSACCHLTRVKRKHAMNTAAAMKPSSIPALVDALAAEVKTRRAEIQFTQEDLAAKSGLDRPYVSLIEVGLKQPTLSVLYRLAYGLDLSLSQFAARIEKRYGRHTPD
jgi:DNA-binding XRE family transcriptional regulator